MTKISASGIVGIDLGTTNSAAAVMIGGEPVIIPSEEGLTPYGKMFPSVVAFTDENERLVGELARMHAVENPDRTVSGIKRKMGTSHKVKIGSRDYTPQEISAMILQKIKIDAETYLGTEVEKAVITVPAYFNDNQRTATKEAGKIAGLEVVRLINEPTAASLAYGLDKEKKEELKIAVLDLGAGTFDVTILKMIEGLFKVISTSGDTQLGGLDMDEKIVKFLLDELEKEYQLDIRRDKKAMQILRYAAERAKIELSTASLTNVSIQFPFVDVGLNLNMSLDLGREKVEELIEPVIQRLDDPINQALEDAKMTPEDIDKVVLVGGPTRMPVVREKIERFFGKEAEKGIDPMECVAKGAAIQAGVLAGEIDDVLLLDVIPLSLGIETSGGIFTKMMGRNTTIPVEESEIFTTPEDNQTRMAIHVLQGERAMAADNTTLGLFSFDDIPAAPKRTPMIDVSFDIDADGILNVRAEDLDTGKKREIKIEGSTKLSEEEIGGMVKEAKRYEKEDKKRKERIETLNQAKAVIDAAELVIKETDQEDEVNEERKKEVKEGVLQLKEGMKGEGDIDIRKIKRYTEELKRIMQKMLIDKGEVVV
ncbi:MAG: molecular chaperone DnaK [Methanomicrobia archaeon]|nr:molecular chaperone DnaK [Methanomicrobia archaeon]